MIELDPNAAARIAPWAAGAGPATALAVVSYCATVTLGLLSARGRAVPRAWHGRMFLVTCVLTVLAAVLSFAADWLCGLVLALALVPLALLPRFGAPVRKHPRRHVLIALAAAPWYLAAAALAAIHRT